MCHDQHLKLVQVDPDETSDGPWPETPAVPPREPVTVARLREELRSWPDDAIVVLALDSDGERVVMLAEVGDPDELALTYNDGEVLLYDPNEHLPHAFNTGYPPKSAFRPAAVLWP